jgi:opacity protein-like surface antigen
MKTILIAGMLMVLLAAALLAGCARPAAGVPGPDQPAQSAPAAAAGTAGTVAPADNGTAAAPVVAVASAVRIADILQDPKGFGGKTVVVEGKIASECPSGCWFTLKDGNAVIYIDLAPSNLVIPQRKGSNAKVTAEVVTEGSDVYLIGKKVDF